MKSGEIDNRDRLIARVGGHLDRRADALVAASRLPDPERRAALRQVARSLRGMARELRWLGTGEVDPPQRKRLDLLRVVREVTRPWNERRRDRAPIRVEAESKSVVDRWDADHIGCIVGELLSNACKHGGEHPIVVNVRERIPGIVTITVENVGDHPLPRRPFARFVRGPKPTGEGMGVGLWLTEELARRNSGKLSFARAPHGGVRAIVELARPADDPRPPRRR
jgi:signal transduction histidine kinase